MSNVTTTNQISNALEEWYNPNLIDLAQPVLLANQFGVKTTIPSGSSPTVKWGSFNDLKEPTGDLSEGIDPEGQLLQITRMTATCKQYGDLVILTDVVELTVSDPVANQAAIKLSEQMGKFLDTLTFDVLVATGSVYNCQYGANGKTPTELTQEDSDDIVQTLMSNDAPLFSKISEGVNKIGTEPLDESYYVLSHTNIYKDLKKLSSWVPVAKYPDPSIRRKGERGYTDNARWCLSSKAPINTSGADDIYYSFYIGMDAYGVVDIDGGNAEMIFTQPGGPGDRLKQRSSLGWKAWHAAKILQERNLIRAASTLA